MGCLLHLKQKQQGKIARNLKNQGKMSSICKTDKDTHVNDIELCDLAPKESNTAILRKLNELQEKTERQFN